MQSKSKKLEESGGLGNFFRMIQKKLTLNLEGSPVSTTKAS